MAVAPSGSPGLRPLQWVFGSNAAPFGSYDRFCRNLCATPCSSHETSACHKPSSKRLDNRSGPAYAPHTRPLYNRQPLYSGPLLQAIGGHDQGRACGRGGGAPSAPDAPDRHGGRSVPALHPRRFGGGRQRGMAGMWELPTPPPPTAHRPPRTGRNPQTGDTVPIPAKQVPWFPVGKVLRALVEYPPAVPGRPRPTPPVVCTRHTSPCPQCLTLPRRRGHPFPEGRRFRPRRRGLYDSDPRCRPSRRSQAARAKCSIGAPPAHPP